MNELSSDAVKYIIARIIDNANDTIKDYKQNKNDDFVKGKKLAYYEVLDTIKNELSVRNQNLNEFGLNIDLDKIF